MEGRGRHALSDKHQACRYAGWGHAKNMVLYERVVCERVVSVRPNGVALDGMGQCIYNSEYGIVNTFTSQSEGKRATKDSNKYGAINV